MKSIAVAGALAVGLMSSVAMAADLPQLVEPPMVEPFVPPVLFSWTGPYIGVNAGWAFGGDDRVGIWTSNPDRYLGDIGTLGADGLFGGLQAGYNVQFNNFVVGVEGDIQFSGISDSIRGQVGGNDFAARVDVDWFGTLRARAGFAMDRVMLYGTGGLAFADINYRVNIPGGAPGANQQAQVIRSGATDWGWVVGAGVEAAVVDNVSVKLEYQYLNFGRDRVGNGNFHTFQTTDFHTVRGGVNFRF